MPLYIVHNDILKMNTDAIVNAANTKLLMGSGVCGAIFKAAGENKLQKACNKFSPIKIGEAVITSGFNLPAKYIIHTAGLVYGDGKQCEAELLRLCYVNSLKLAVKKKCKTIAFPFISSGGYGFSKEQALKIAIDTIENFLNTNELGVYLVVFDRTSFAINKTLIGGIDSFIDENYVDEQLILIQDSVVGGFALAGPLIGGFALAGPLINVLSNLDEPFSKALIRLIDAKGKTDVEVYKKANIDRKLFSKIRTGKNYMPSKKTIVALAISLELSLSQTNELLKKAGFTLSRSQKFDVIIEYFIVNEIYDVFEINEVLFYYDQPLLGG